MEIGYNYKLIGDSDMMGRVFKEIAKAVILAIILIYMVLGAEFESFRQPLVIMMSLPFAVIGAVLALLLANQTANMMSLIGFTMLLGLVTKNAILLVDYANQARDRGKDVKSAILEACSLRPRPWRRRRAPPVHGRRPDRWSHNLDASDTRRRTIDLPFDGTSHKEKFE